MSRFRSAAVAVAALALLAFLYVRSRSVDPEEAERVRRLLVTMRDHAAPLDSDVLEVKSGLVGHFDTLRVRLAACRAVLDRMPGELPGLEDPEFADLRERVAACAAAHAEKARRIEDFTMHAAALNSSVSNLTVIQEAFEETGDPSGLALLKDALLYCTTGRAETRERLRLQIEAWPASPPGASEETRDLRAVLLSHARLVLRNKGRADDLASRALRVPLGRRADEIRLAYAASYEERVRAANVYRGILVGFALVLLVAVGGTLLSLHRKTVQLRTQNEVILHAADGIMILREDGTIESLNPAAEALFGRPSPVPITLEAGSGVRRLEQAGQRPDGTPFAAELTVSEVLLGKLRRFTVVARDVTERKRVEKMKSEFISTVSHELRTPLTSIRGSLGLVVGGAIGALPAPAKAMLEIAQKNSERLVHLINDILDIQKIESGGVPLDLKLHDPRALVEQALEANRGFGQAYGVDLARGSAETGAAIRADGGRVLQVLSNLISNAVKFSPRGGTVTVSLERVSGFLRFSVADRGAGIPAEFRGRIFQRFAQADSSDTRDKGGTGLGLHISRSLVELMGGRIGFEDREGGGTVFWFQLPAADPTPVPPSDPLSPRPPVAILHG